MSASPKDCLFGLNLWNATDHATWRAKTKSPPAEADGNLLKLFEVISKR
jgi:hypothetical protein